jgi:ferredoxin
MSAEPQTLLITVDGGRCTGHGRCADVAPEVFEIDDDGYSTRRHQGPQVAPTSLKAAAELGEASCPERAISVLVQTAQLAESPGDVYGRAGTGRHV